MMLELAAAAADDGTWYRWRWLCGSRKRRELVDPQSRSVGVAVADLVVVDALVQPTRCSARYSDRCLAYAALHLWLLAAGGFCLGWIVTMAAEYARRGCCL